MWDHLLRRLEPGFVTSEARRVGAKLWRRMRRLDSRRARLRPAAGSGRGRVLLSYIVDPLLRSPGAPIPHTHTHFWESLTIAHTFLDLGFEVDVISWINEGFVPSSEDDYDYVIDVRMNLERLTPLLGSNAVKIFHADTAHHAFHNAAQKRRLRELAERRHIRLAPHKTLPINRGIETCDCATYLGNDFTRETYAFAGKPMFRVPVSVPFTYPWPATKDFDAVRRRFLWFGSDGFVHKGLDIVLEAFAGMPGYHLTVCGPIRRERAFERAFVEELHKTPNIRTAGWVDVAPPHFSQLASSVLGLVYPSSSEGGGSSALTCMHAGVIPLLTRESSVDIDRESGVLLEDASVAEIRRKVRAMSERPTKELRETARAAWELARSRHTRERFQEAYRSFVERLLDDSWRTGDG